MELKLNNLVNGFLIKEKTEITEISATMYKMEHERSGATLIFLDREDENKSFSIAFKTIPEDSTGVFHIIEHSVLCGSEKYRVKEPFVELLKGSLNTFLNAMTFPDKTMYPVASRNDKDFHNLVSVYMDAVLHPAILENKNIFLQEGWHYEVDSESGELTRSGVVLNEMRGAFSSADEVASYHLTNMLYPSSCYRHESGGKPENITDLTYEQFCDSHRKYYHPSNSQIFLDGSVDLDNILPLLDSYLSEYERCDVRFEIEDGGEITEKVREVEYEISSAESESNKTRMVIGYRTCRFDEKEKNVAISILLDTLCSSNESPIKKALLSSGLCDDVYISPYDSIKENALSLSFINVKDGKCDELYSLFNESIKKIASEGIDKTMLEASLNALEFKIRERDFGTLPRGIVYAMTVLESSLYGGAPEQNLSYGDTFISLREKLSGDYFEALLTSLFLENENQAILIMHPSSTLGERRAEEEKRLLAEIKASLSEEELREIIKTRDALKAWQQTPDTKEGLSTLPRLLISDISDEVEEIPSETLDVDGVPTLSQRLATNGIMYADLYFDVSDLTEDEIFDLHLLNAVLCNTATEDYSAIDLQNLIKRELGSFDVSMTALSRSGDTKIYATLSSSMLESKEESFVKIFPEVLYTSVYKNKEAIFSIVHQMKLSSDEHLTSSGHLAGFNRASAYVSAEGAVQEYYSGYEAHLKLKALEENLDSEFTGLADRLYGLAAKIFTKERLTLSLTGSYCENFARSIVSSLKCGEKVTPVCKISPFGVCREGIEVPAQASYAELVCNLNSLGEKLTGELRVARSLLSYGYLWGEVRVQGGAYGVGLIVRNNGNVGFYSYRDPSPERTLGIYRKAADFLRSYAKSGEDLTTFIIGAVGDASPLTTPKLKGVIAITRYLRGVGIEDERRLRREMLSTNPEALMRVADLIDKMCEINAVCVVAGKTQLDTCTALDNILKI